MTHIKTTRGLDIPISGKPSGEVQPLIPGGEARARTPKIISLNLDSFDDLRFKLHAKNGTDVKIGQPIVQDKALEGRLMPSPASGRIIEVRRGLKRRLLDFVIEVDEEEEYHELGSLDVASATREQILQKFLDGGIFFRIRKRPFNILASPEKLPRCIFVKGLESAPYAPPVHLQIQGHESEFQTGLTALSKLTDGKVHLVYHKNETNEALIHAQNVERHTAEGPHPISHFSLHIQEIAPIQDENDVVWTVKAHDVVAIGHLLQTGRVLTEKVISIAGQGLVEGRQGYFRVREGIAVADLIADRLRKEPVRLISGDPLHGEGVESSDFLKFSHNTFCAIPEPTSREALHFFRLGLNKYSFSRAYLSGHLDNSKREYDFTTNLHGEPRPFIDPTLYDKVMPLNVPTMQLVKAVMAEDFELRTELGLLDVDAEDFALPTFVDPSKIEMTEIIKQGLRDHASEVL
ncbi:MAG: Na(+)-translocating NADH-quinone reductase subunit A [Waddliaceae bacterium]